MNQHNPHQFTTAENTQEPHTVERTTQNNPFISIVAPCYNEYDNLDTFYERVKSVIDTIGKSYEIVLVNDGSKDKTLDKLIELHKKDSNVKVINLARNFGKEIALTAGLNHAVGQVVVPIDADLQDPPEFIPKMIAKWEEGYDVVYAVRSSRAGESAIKKFTSFMFYRVMRWLTRFDLPKDTGDFRLMDQRVVEEMRKIREHHRFMKGLFTWVGFRQTGLKYERDPRFAGKTTFNYWKLTNLAIEGITSFSYFPLRFASFVGVGVSAGAFLYALFLIVRTILYGPDEPGYPSLMVVILFLGGIQLIALGVIGEYLGRTYAEVKDRPLYIIRDVYE